MDSQIEDYGQHGPGGVKHQRRFEENQQGEVQMQFLQKIKNNFVGGQIRPGLFVWGLFQYGNSNYVYLLVQKLVICTCLCLKYFLCLKKIGINRNVANLLQNSVGIRGVTPVKVYMLHL